MSSRISRSCGISWQVTTACIVAPRQKKKPPKITAPLRPSKPTQKSMTGGKAAMAAPTPKIMVMMLSWKVDVGGIGDNWWQLKHTKTISFHRFFFTLDMATKSRRWQFGSGKNRQTHWPNGLSLRPQDWNASKNVGSPLTFETLPMNFLLWCSHGCFRNHNNLISFAFLSFGQPSRTLRILKDQISCVSRIWSSCSRPLAKESMVLRLLVGISCASPLLGISKCLVVLSANDCIVSGWGWLVDASAVRQIRQIGQIHTKEKHIWVESFGSCYQKQVEPVIAGHRMVGTMTDSARKFQGTFCKRFVRADSMQYAEIKWNQKTTLVRSTWSLKMKSTDSIWYFYILWGFSGH